MSYIKPQNVLSPREKNVKVIRVLLDEGEDKFAAAVIEYNGDICVGTRWNGNNAKPGGFPTSRGVPIWQVEHEDLTQELIALFTAKARNEPWVPELTLEQQIAELTKKGFDVTLSTRSKQTAASAPGKSL